MGRTRQQYKLVLYGAVSALLYTVVDARSVLACPDSKNGLDHIQDLFNLVTTAIFGYPMFNHMDQWLLLYFFLIHFVALNIFLLVSSKALPRTFSTASVQDASSLRAPR